MFTVMANRLKKRKTLVVTRLPSAEYVGAAVFVLEPHGWEIERVPPALRFLAGHPVHHIPNVLKSLRLGWKWQENLYLDDDFDGAREEEDEEEEEDDAEI